MIKGLDGKHYLSSQSMLAVMILKSLRHGNCVNCGVPTRTLEKAGSHWDKVMGSMYKQDKPKGRR